MRKATLVYAGELRGIVFDTVGLPVPREISAATARCDGATLTVTIELRDVGSEEDAARLADAFVARFIEEMALDAHSIVGHMDKPVRRLIEIVDDQDPEVSRGEAVARVASTANAAFSVSEMRLRNIGRHKAASRSWRQEMKVDMSSRAVTARLRLVSQLTALSLSLGKARPVSGRTLRREVIRRGRPR